MELETKVVKEINLSLTLEEINLLLAGLGELPAKMSISVIEKIRSQATKQLNDLSEQQVQ